MKPIRVHYETGEKTKEGEAIVKSGNIVSFEETGGYIKAVVVDYFTGRIYSKPITSVYVVDPRLVYED